MPATNGRPRLSIALLALCARRGAGVDPIVTAKCGASQYFDIDSLLCTGCPSGQRPHPSGFACECTADSVAASAEAVYDAGTDTDAHCVACAAGLVPARALAHAALGGSCLPCGEDVEPFADVELVTVNGSAALGPITITCPNATVSEPTLGACTALDTPDERCPAATSDDFAQCACPAGYVVSETFSTGALLSAKRCVPCAPNAAPSPTDPSRCEPCDDERMIFDGVECACPAGWARESHDSPVLWGRRASCVLSAARDKARDSADASVASRITYTALVAGTLPPGSAATETVDSASLAQIFLPAAAACIAAVTSGRPDPADGGRSPCQAVANLCVLHDYAQSSPACALYRAAQELAPSGGLHGEGEWRARLPWLYYAEARTALTDRSLDLRVAVATGTASASRLPSSIRLVLNSYSLNGTWLGLTNVTTELQICAGSAAELASYQRVGTSLRSSCELDIARDLAALAPLLGSGRAEGAPSSGAELPPAAAAASAAAQLRGAFHELYIRDAAGALFPVPVRVINYPGGVNDNAAQSRRTALQLPSVLDPSTDDDVLTRRFFLVDALSGIRATSSAGSLPAIVRFAARVSLQLRVSETDPSQMLPPVLTVAYADARVGGDGSAVETVSASFEVAYSMELAQYWNAVTILIVFACVLTLVGWLIASFAWMRRNQRAVLDGEFAINALVHAVNMYADIFFWLIVALCAHWYVFFKGQTDAFLMLPDEATLGPISLMLALALMGKAVGVLALVVKQSRADIFLIDWETAHGTLVGKAGEAAEEAPISIWRSILVANELNELQTMRLTRPSLSIILVLACMVGLDFERFGKAVPGDASGDVSRVQTHTLLRFAVATFVWAVVMCGQAALLKLIYIPYVEDKVGQLVDLLSVANISVLMLPEPMCGYYLHGRSVHAHADTDMLELNRQLRAEEDGLSSQRGLSAASDVQTFQVHLTPRMRELYDHKFLYAALAQAAPNANGPDAPVRRRMRGASGAANVPLTGISIERARRAGDGFRSNPEGAVARYVEMNSLLREFIDGTLAGHEFSIREKTYFERLLRLPPDMSFARDSIFLFDSSGAWTRAMLYGHEYDLVLLEVLVYTVVDWSLRSSFLAGAIAYLTWLAVERLRAYLGQSNLAKKTLIDDRFLI